jgi:hypothetical protein
VTDPGLLLALIADLYGQVRVLTAELDAARAEVARLQSRRDES